MQTSRTLSLEALRGVAAVIVTIHHFGQSFAEPIFNALLGTPFYLVMSGDGAVAVFFLLSGAVNCRPLFRDPSLRTLVRTVLRRYPRLVLPTLLATLFAWALYALDLYHFRAAAALNGSALLGSMFDTQRPDFQPSFLDALYQGTLRCFLNGQSNYVSPLWTMQWELMGSLLVLPLAALIARRSLASGLAMGIALAVLSSVLMPPGFLALFIAGTLVTFALMRAEVRLTPAVSAVLAVIALYLLGYAYPVGDYAWFGTRDGVWLDVQSIAVHLVGAVLLMSVALGSAAVQRLVSGRWAQVLGELSFPIFLLHIPVYCSASSWVLVKAAPAVGMGAATVLAWLTAAVITVPLAWLVARIDRAWGRLVNLVVEAVMTRVRRPVAEAA
jgi:peptidoglycan/LPS O-acetylase OafA/YrhL